MDILRCAAALIFGLLVYFTAKSDVAVAMGVIGFGVWISAGWNEARFERVMKAINPQWGKDGQP